ARIKALMAQLVKEYPINNKYSKESSVYINTANPKEYIKITYEMCKKWARMIFEEKDTNVECVQPYGHPLGFPYGTFVYSVPPWIGQPAMMFGLGNSSTQKQPRIPSPELLPQEGDYSFDHFLEFIGLNHLKPFEQNHLHNNGLDNIKVLLTSTLHMID
ncbi:hypothetical protein BY996DRAFT_6611673, partial [Phakopsora pachyrhizi]